MPIILQSKFFAFMIWRVMRNRLLWLGMLGLAVIYGLNGCVKANIITGQNQIDLGLTQIVKVDTLTPVLSTLFIDSIPTSGKGTAMVGGYDDAYFGSIKTRTYVQVSPPPLTDLVVGSAFDSMTLYVVPTKYYYGDTTQFLDVYAEQLQTQMIYPPQQFQWYNNDSFPVSKLLGHARVRINPSDPDTIYIRIDSAVGQMFFNMMKANDQNLVNAQQFATFFPGIRLSSGYGPNPGIIYGLKDSVMMKLYYHNPDLARSWNFMKFSFTNSANQFLEIQNKPVPPLDQFPRVFSEVVQQRYSFDAGFNHMVYVNPMLGYTAKVEFPYLRNMYLQDTTLRTITKAQLILRPLVPSFTTQYQLPSSLGLFQTDFSNQPGSQISQGILSLDYGGSDTQYTFDITSYLLEQLNDPTATAYKRGLVIMPTSGNYYTQLNRFVFGDKLYQSPYSSPDFYQSEVILYYVSTKNTL